MLKKYLYLATSGRKSNTLVTQVSGGQRIISADKLHKKNNIKLVEKAVKGMLPKNKLGADLFRNLKVFPGSEHDHEAQKPKPIDVNSKI